MSVAHNIIPSRIVVMLSPRLQEEVILAALVAEDRTDARQRQTEAAACALQWIETELDLHARRCSICMHHECSGLRSLRRQRERAYNRYKRSLRQLRGGR